VPSSATPRDREELERAEYLVTDAGESSAASTGVHDGEDREATRREPSKPLPETPGTRLEAAPHTFVSNLRDNEILRQTVRNRFPTALILDGNPPLRIDVQLAARCPRRFGPVPRM
jgi:hypothetical protein